MHQLLERFKAATEHYAVEETARLGGLEVRIIAQSTEWGQKKVHLYLAEWKRMKAPVASAVFVKDHNTLGVNNAEIPKGDYRAFWDSHLGFGIEQLPAWLLVT
ncbi:hypothetical protein VM1G_10481 [Cytospora mali]|uniref:Uncharacterized protein n=1 Tax=Cytospora mali TaxID=578113 RepID=A0A194VIF5_CYTMA|nr:hypothetical protein VM1G_10481 [Valsa mali]